MSITPVKPFIRWVGGKTQLLPQLLELAPKEFGTYHEPFLGGGALFFALKPKASELGDFNQRLVNAFECVRDHYPDVVAHMRTFKRSADVFYEQRSILNKEGCVRLPDPQAAARFIFLNKTCFNGLWRENNSGEFNVPYGGDRPGKFLDERVLLDCSIALHGAHRVRWEDFGNVQFRAKFGDFVYFDPPYIPLTVTSFVDYTSDGFGAPEQLRLRDIALDLKSRGVHVMLSNSDTPIVRELYRGFKLHEVQARRSVNSNGKGRGKVGELIIQ
jgi:DNA adenine methylase